MNPHAFCRERAYPKTLLLTYSFDPVFFERVVLPDLWAGRSDDVLVVGDREQIRLATTAVSVQLSGLGRQYLLAAANSSGAFHPKVLLRLNARGGAVMVGSANATSSGWGGGTQEAAVGWTLGPGQDDSGAWVPAFLDDVIGWCTGALEKEALRRMKDMPWLASQDSLVTSPILYSTQQRTLASALAQRWAGRQFEEVRILTGSTDESGAFLRWAHATLGIKRAVVALTPSMASFRAERLADLPIDLRLIPVTAAKPMHAKFFWFDGPGGSAAVMGSANCSRAAWLLAPDRGGNVEAVVVYDTPERAEFHELLDTFNGDSFAAADLLLSKPADATEPVAPETSFELTSLTLASGRLSATVTPAPTPEMLVDILLRRERLSMTMRPSASGPTWMCDMTIDGGSASRFGVVEVHQGEHTWRTSPRWVDDLAELSESRQSVGLWEPFRALEFSTTPTEQRQMLEDLRELSQALFRDPDSFRDPRATTGPKDEDEASTLPVNPNDLIRHLAESPDAVHRLGPGAGSISLDRIMRILFDGGVERPRGLAGGYDPTGDTGGENEVLVPNRPRTESADEAQDSPPIPPRFRERLAKQIEAFLSELGSAQFAAGCFADQMVQAVAFPLTVAAVGQSRGWVSDQLAEKWGLETFAVLFRGRTRTDGGLLRSVADRYTKAGDRKAFEEIVGDGRLWTALVAALGKTKWPGKGSFVDKAIAMREVFTSNELLAAAQGNVIAALVAKISIEGAREYIAELAPAAQELLGRIEAALRLIWQEEARGQVSRHITHRVGDLLWRDGSGWATCLGETAIDAGHQKIQVRLRGFEMVVGATFYVNVDESATRHPALRALMADLQSLMGATVPDA